MTAILGIIIFSVLLKVLPFALIGFILKGWKPLLVPLILTLGAVFMFGYWTFGWLTIPVDYFLAALGYAIGAKIRTGKAPFDENLGRNPEEQLSLFKGAD